MRVSLQKEELEQNKNFKNPGFVKKKLLLLHKNARPNALAIVSKNPNIENVLFLLYFSEHSSADYYFFRNFKLLVCKKSELFKASKNSF